MSLDWLVVAPHPDDGELGCGGVLARQAAGGGAVGILDLTRGEMGSKGTPELRQQEAEQASRILGLAYRHNLGLPDGFLQDGAEQVLPLAAVLRQVKPRWVWAPWWADRHPDHTAAYHLVKRAVHLAGLGRSPLEGSPHKPERVLFYPGNHPATPGLAMDISDQIEVWQAAVLAYGSQFSGPAVSETVGPGGVESRRALRRYWGNTLGVAYAEPFISELPWRID